MTLPELADMLDRAAKGMDIDEAHYHAAAIACRAHDAAHSQACEDGLHPCKCVACDLDEELIKALAACKP